MFEAHGDTSRARLLIVDDQAFMRVAVGAILGTDDALEVVGEAQDGEEAIARCRELRPDLILMDVSMPKMGGIEATRKIKAEFPLTSVLILTAHADHSLLMDAVKAGAAGYILKGEHPDHVLDDVRAVLGGETPLDQGLAMRLLRSLGEERAASCPPTDAATGRADHLRSRRSVFAQPAHAQGDGSPRPPSLGRNQPPDRRRAAPLPLHGQEAPGAHHLETQGLRPHPGCSEGDRDGPAACCSWAGKE
jgi:DNA-binding NarL/FixJ family response regulator